MRTNEEMLDEIMNANNGEGPDPIASYQGNAVEIITQAVHDRQQLDKFIDSMVAVAQHQGVSWAKIGRALGVSRQAAHERYSNLKIAA